MVPSEGGSMSRQAMSPVNEQTKELGTMVSRVAAMSGTVRESLTGRKSLTGGDLVKEANDLIEEIAFTLAREDEEMFGEPIESRRPVFRYQGILTHLQIVAATMASLVDEQQKRFRDGISLSGNALDHTDLLFTHQEMILCTLKEAIRSGDRAHLRAVCRACQELTHFCRQWAAEHERRRASDPGASLFLKTLELLHELVRHEREIVKLLVRWQCTASDQSPLPR